MDRREDRLWLRDATTSDVELLINWWHSANVMIKIGSVKSLLFDAEELKQEILNKEIYRYIMLFEDIPFGEMSCRIEDNVAKVGVMVCESDYQRIGLRRMALKILIDECFNEYNVDKVVTEANLKNKYAHELFNELGFTQTAVVYNDWVDKNGDEQSTAYFEIEKNTLI